MLFRPILGVLRTTNKTKEANMLFNSLEFLIFLPIVFLLYWYVFRKRQIQNLLIVISSYIFYGWWDWRFLILIVFTSLCSYGCGLLIVYYEGQRRIQQIVSMLNIVLNLCILVAFKYYNFFIENLEAVLGIFGWKFDWITINIILPVGISFYTFQALSYTIDIYKKKIKPTHDLIEFCAYISFFPQLVAGPIERATNLLPQFQKKRTFEYTKAVDGSRQMLCGFFKKLVIADNCAMIVNEYWNHYQELPGLALIALGILFTFQIYCDFSGYSDIAIGCARLFGFNLIQNFNYPYFSKSIPEFWRRWHISLMTWFRDYIYFPLGGSKCGRWKTICNTLIVFFVSGLWHGANWTFVCWGIYHAFLISLYIILGIKTKKNENLVKDSFLPSIKEVCQISLTFTLVVIGWIIFRAESIYQAVDYFYCMITNPFIGDRFFLLYILYGVLLLLVEWLQRDKQHVLQFSAKWPFNNRWIRYTIYYIILIFISQNLTHQQTFIYFQF